MNTRRLLILAVTLLAPLAAYSEPTSSPVTITSLRPYGNFILLTANIAPGNFCATSNYLIDLNANTAGKNLYAAALGAVLTNKTVQLELAACSSALPTYNTLQSITVLP
jgi:hypothetical protein